MKQRDFEQLLTSIRQAGHIRRGQQPASRVVDVGPAEVRSVRRGLGLTQDAFAAMIGVSVGTLRNWEQGRRTPDGPARALLKVASTNPRAVAKALLE